MLWKRVAITIIGTTIVDKIIIGLTIAVPQVCYVERTAVAATLCAGLEVVVAMLCLWFYMHTCTLLNVCTAVATTRQESAAM